MKQAFKFLLAGLLLVGFQSCSDDNDDDNGVPSAVATNLKSGTWRITTYVDNSNDETADFNGFNFTFNNGGTVSAVNNVLTVTGTWSTGTDDSQSKLDLDFAGSSLSNFLEISEDWEILSQSSTQVSLRHISGGGGGTDLLVFQKN